MQIRRDTMCRMGNVMTKANQALVLALALLGSACTRHDGAASAGIDTKHYNRADFAAKCFGVPDQNQLIEIKAFLKLDDQGALDYDYRRSIKSSPSGDCDDHNPDGSIKATPAPAAHQGESHPAWVENAPANDMSHYGDALPGGKRH